MYFYCSLVQKKVQYPWSSRHWCVIGYWCSHKRTGPNPAAGSFPSTPAFNPWVIIELHNYKMRFFTGQCRAARDRNKSIAHDCLSTHHSSLKQNNQTQHKLDNGEYSTAVFSGRVVADNISLHFEMYFF